jgi:N-[(2S)-2-amino-2-carboxyethyl]-L-glutamate dehydrogenase
MEHGDLLILTGTDVEALLDGREDEVLDAVQAAYRVHGGGDSSLPHSTFLRFPDSRRNRIISLIGYLGGRFRAAGMKWIASFPDNTQKGLARASAVMVMNSVDTGVPEAFLEGSVISARRTAASAALAARHLHAGEPERIGIIGCGLISFEIVRFLRAVYPGMDEYVVYDLSPARAAEFGDELRAAFPGIRVESAESPRALLAACPVTALATTAIDPHVGDLSMCPPGATILHVSLRDFTPEVVLGADNVVDDVDHVMRAETSVHLAELRTGNRGHVRCTLADVLDGRAPARRDADGPCIFSPFGLGVLDLALGALVMELAKEEGRGTVVESFLPHFARTQV